MIRSPLEKIRQRWKLSKVNADAGKFSLYPKARGPGSRSLFSKLVIRSKISIPWLRGINYDVVPRLFSGSGESRVPNALARAACIFEAPNMKHWQVLMIPQVASAPRRHYRPEKVGNISEYIYIYPRIRPFIQLHLILQVGAQVWIRFAAVERGSLEIRNMPSAIRCHWDRAYNSLLSTKSLDP